MRGTARGQGRVYQAAGDQKFYGTHHHQHEHPQDEGPFQAFFVGSGPGRVLIVLGVIVVLAGFTGWASIVFGFARDDVTSPSDVLGAELPSGVPVGVVYFLGVGFGGILASIGSSMAKAAARHGSQKAHLALTLLLIIVSLGGLLLVLDGAPVSALTPRFGSRTAADGPVEVISAGSRSARNGGLTMTVTGIENSGGKGRVHVQLVNNSGRRLTLPAAMFQLSDAQGRTYAANSFAKDWTADIGDGATHSGVLQLEKRVIPAAGPMRAEFTTVFGGGVQSIAVTKIPAS